MQIWKMLTVCSKPRLFPGQQGGANTAQSVNFRIPTAQFHDTEADHHGCAEPLQEAARAGSTKGPAAVMTLSKMVITARERKIREVSGELQAWVS